VKPAAVPGTFFFESCQRYLWLSLKELQTEIPSADVYAGADGYRFLMSISAGLESEIIGETDIFGQLKTAWSGFEKSALKDELSPWMQKLFEDTKELRSRYLQNLGSASYGSLVRKLIARGPGPVLVIGAGQLGQSIAPYLLSHCEVWIANRDEKKLDAFYEQLAHQSGARVRKIAAHELDEAMVLASQVVICIPMGVSSAEIKRDRAWINARAELGGVLHLGTMREQAGEWLACAEFKCLDDLFELQKSINDLKSVQVIQAKKACAERSKLRALGASLSLPHGWEDLASFA
jgi:hypothetical protein